MTFLQLCILWILKMPTHRKKIVAIFCHPGWFFMEIQENAFFCKQFLFSWYLRKLARVPKNVNFFFLCASEFCYVKNKCVQCTVHRSRSNNICNTARCVLNTVKYGVLLGASLSLQSPKFPSEINKWRSENVEYSKPINMCTHKTKRVHCRSEWKM